MQRTISAMVGKGSVNHNSRKFQSMMVVTSPIGEKAPPELAAMMTRDA